MQKEIPLCLKPSWNHVSFLKIKYLVIGDNSFPPLDGILSPRINSKSKSSKFLFLWSVIVKRDLNSLQGEISQQIRTLADKVNSNSKTMTEFEESLRKVKSFYITEFV